MTALNYLLGAGLSVESAGDRLRVSPAALITEAIGQFIRDHKAEILAELASANASATADPIQLKRTEQAVEQTAQQRTVLTAATASAAWRKADAAFINHLMSCHACNAARSRYCPTGQALRQQYDRTPMEESR